MKMLRFLFAFLLTVPCWAATPSFQSFFSNDFLVLPPMIYAKHTNDGGTNVNINTTIINTNVTQINNFTTNIFDNSVTIITNSTVIFTNSTVTINGTNVATINETIGRVPYKSGTNAFSDSSLIFVDTNTTETVNLWTENVGVTNLVTGGLVVSFDSGLGFGYLTNFPAGTGTLANDGANHIFWDTSGQIWTNIAGSVQTTVGNEVRVTNLYSAQTLNASGAFRTLSNSVEFLVAGTNVINPFGKAFIYLVSTVTTGAVVQLTAGDGPGSHVWLINVLSNSTFTLPAGELSASPGTKVAIRGGGWTPTEEGEILKLVGSPTGFLEEDRANPNGPSPALGTNYWTNILGVLQPIDLTLPVKLTNQLQFNLAGTNVLYASNQFLVYSNASVTIPGGYATVSGDGSEARYTAGGNLAIVRGIAGVDLIDALASGNDLRWGFNAFTPLQTGTALGAFGGGSQPWNHAMIGSSNQWGFMGVTSGTPNVLINGTNYALAPSSAVTAINATDTYLPARQNATAFTNSPLYTVAATNIGIDSGFYFGPGTSNWFGRFGTDLWLTNGGSSTTVGGLVIMTGDGSSNKLTAAGNLANLFGVAGVGLYDSFSSGKEVRWTSNTLMPINSAGSLGQNAAVNSSPLQWSFTSQKTNFVNGFTSSITTNYSRFTTYHGGTNDSVHLVSEGAGIAGSAKPILVSVALVTSGVSTVTNIVEFDGTSGANTTGVLIYENGIAQRVTIGANDSAGVGFRILKVPN